MQRRRRSRFSQLTRARASRDPGPRGDAGETVRGAGCGERVSREDGWLDVDDGRGQPNTAEVTRPNQPLETGRPLPSLDALTARIQRVVLRTAAILVALTGLAEFSHAADTPREVRIAVIGDSTVCEYPATSNIRGWGHFLAPAFQAHVRVLNLAKSGRSTKTFIKEGLWTKTLAEKPSFVLIQFGHNDSHARERPESTDAATDYRDFLRRYVDEARAGGATPVLVTPMHRRRFDKDGKVTQELLPYADAMKVVAKEKRVALVDLHAASGELFQKLGDAGSADLSCSATDRTHFSEKGAKAMAELVLKGLATVEARLAALLKL